MQGDFSRRTFDPKKHYKGVLMQQGRVQVDADWNEQREIMQHRVEIEALDVIGGCGAPLKNPGFAITGAGGQLLIGAGRYYVDGILCENETTAAYTTQPHLPNPPDIPTQLLAAGTPYGLVYLDVWHRHVTPIDDDLIREKALNGADTATRIQTVWQVKVLPVHLPSQAQQLEDRRTRLLILLQQARERQDFKTIATIEETLAVFEQAIKDYVDCGADYPEWDNLIAPPTGKMNAHTAPGGTEKPCVLPPSAGYQRLENQLYRVEIHKGGDQMQATFKWSRENASVITAIEKVEGSKLTVHDVGRDENLGFADGDWVEIVEDVSELTGPLRPLLQIDHVDAASRAITLKLAPATTVDLTRHPKLRRWEQAGTTATADGVAMTNTWMPLEGGIEVEFSAGTYAPGDYWLIPARTATGEIEWPPYAIPNVAPIAQPRQGVRHHYCRLAIVELDTKSNTLTRIDDCRTLFPPLAKPAIHITNTNWRNDAPFSIRRLWTEGLVLRLDAPPERRSVTDETFIVTLELPYGNVRVGSVLDQTFILEGQISAVGDTITWKPSPELLLLLLEILELQLTSNSTAQAQTTTTDTTPANAANPAPQATLPVNEENIIRRAVLPEEIATTPESTARRTEILRSIISPGLLAGVARTPSPMDTATVGVGVAARTAVGTVATTPPATAATGTTATPPAEAATGTAVGTISTTGFERVPAASFQPYVTPQLRLRVALKGHVIWAGLDSDRRYLDGQAFGVPESSAYSSYSFTTSLANAFRLGGNTSLTFPTGYGDRASDFESWFYLTLFDEYDYAFGGFRAIGGALL